MPTGTPSNAAWQLNVSRLILVALYKQLIGFCLKAVEMGLLLGYDVQGPRTRWEALTEVFAVLEDLYVALLVHLHVQALQGLLFTRQLSLTFSNLR